jgi:hypothetical protein
MTNPSGKGSSGGPIQRTATELVPAAPDPLRAPDAAYLSTGVSVIYSLFVLGRSVFCPPPVLAWRLPVDGLDRGCQTQSRTQGPDIMTRSSSHLHFAAIFEDHSAPSELIASGPPQKSNIEGQTHHACYRRPYGHQRIIGTKEHNMDEARTYDGDKQ